MSYEPRVFSGSSIKVISSKVCDILDIEEGNIDIQKFPDGEKTVQFIDNVRGQDVFILQSLRTDEDFMETFIMCDAARRASAKRITLVAPFIGYMRQDRKTIPRTPITAKLVFDLLGASGVHRIATMDLHNPAAQGFANYPIDNLYGSSLFFNNMSHSSFENYIVISPDSGGIKMAEAFSKYMNCDYGFIPKIRSNGKIETKDVQGDIQNKNVLIVDDMTETGSTLINAINKCIDGGAEKVTAFITHAPLTEKGKNNLTELPDDTIITTNTVYNDSIKSISCLDISPLLAKVVKRIYKNDSLSALFDIKGF